ncbi:ATP-grasp domain protein [Pirellula sp. SH-Sr6A]|nr:ATP-grasp domain protein [Pirellula sp. SH-Sr6A]
MLRCLLEDLALCGHRVSTVIDSRAVAASELVVLRSIAEVTLVDASSRSEASFSMQWLEAARKADRVLVIAPEIGGELERITQFMERERIPLRGATGMFLVHGADKLAMAASLPSVAHHPKTWTVADWVAEWRENRHDLECISDDGWVCKDRWGAGCSEMKWFPSAGSLLDWLEGPQAGSHFRTESGVESVDRWIVQPWRSGTPASLSLIADGESPPRLVGCMGQTIERRESVQYSGGFGPIEEDRFESLQSWARAVLAPYEGVRGWIGLDMIIPPHRENVAFGTASHRSGHFPKEFLDSAPWSLIEINPRLTTSYVGWREIYGPSLAEGVFGISTGWPSCKRTEKQVTFPIPNLKG